MERHLAVAYTQLHAHACPCLDSVFIVFVLQAKGQSCMAEAALPMIPPPDREAGPTACLPSFTKQSIPTAWICSWYCSAEPAHGVL